MSQEYPTLNRVVEQLQDRNLVTDDAAAALASTTFHAEVESVPTPWYVRALVGVSAWVASFFLLGFLAIAEIVTDETGAIVVGAILLGVSLVLKRLMDHSLFVEQLSFALSLAGQGLFVGGVGVMYMSITIGALAAIGVEALLFLLYTDSLHRLISLFIAGLALLFLIIDQEVPELVHLFTIGLSIGAVLLWQFESRIYQSRAGVFYTPLAFGLPLLLFCTWILDLTMGLDTSMWWVTAVGFALVLLYLGWLILRDLDLPLLSGAGFLLTAAVLLLFIPATQTPGILAALIGLLGSYWRRDRLLLGLSGAFLLFFIGLYYYNLDLTLLTKSYILMGNGIVLLALRWGLTRMESKEEVGGSL